MGSGACDWLDDVLVVIDTCDWSVDAAVATTTGVVVVVFAAAAGKGLSAGVAGIMDRSGGIGALTDCAVIVAVDSEG